MKKQPVMSCPLGCGPLVKRYRVVKRINQTETIRQGAYWSPGRRRITVAYVPLWVCLAHEFSVEINRLSKNIVTRKPKRKPARRMPGSASEAE